MSPGFKIYLKRSYECRHVRIHGDPAQAAYEDGFTTGFNKMPNDAPGASIQFDKGYAAGRNAMNELAGNEPWIEITTPIPGNSGTSVQPMTKATRTDARRGRRANALQ